MKVVVDASNVAYSTKNENSQPQMSNILGMLVLRSPNKTYNDLYLSNFAYTNIQNPLARIEGVGDVNIGIIGEKEDFNYELSCGMGELDVFDDSYTSLGKDKEIDNDAKHTISLDCGVGRVNVYGSGKSL